MIFTGLNSSTCRKVLTSEVLERVTVLLATTQKNFAGKFSETDADLVER
jgi:hypothetical protein